MIREGDYDVPLPEVDPVSSDFLHTSPALLMKLSDRGQATMATAPKYRQYAVPPCSWASYE
jgi:hypothetical protein